MAVTHDKISALLAELRTWEPGELKSTLVQLGERFGLEVFVVDRVAKSEGLRLKVGDELDPDDPNATTLDMDPEELQAAAEAPDPNSDWSFRDKESGMWRRTPDGDFELVE